MTILRRSAPARSHFDAAARQRVTYFDPPAITIGRCKLIGPRMKQVIDFSRVTQDPPAPASRQLLRRGMVVSVHVPHRTTYTEWDPAYHNVGDLRRLESGSFLTMVTSVSPCGRLFHGKRLLKNHSVARISRTGGFHYQPRFRDDGGYGSEPATVEEFCPATYNPAADTTPVLTARRDHITKYWCPSELPGAFVQALKSLATSQVLRALEARLAANDTRRDRFGGARGQRRLEVMARHAAAAKALNETTRQYFNNAVSYSAVGSYGRAGGSICTLVSHIRAHMFPRPLFSPSGELGGNRGRAITARFVAKLARKTGKDWRVADCGHAHVYSAGAAPIARGIDDDGHPILGVLCEGCSCGARPVEFPDGSVHLASPQHVPTCLWSDGVYRTTEEPQVIGQYHSSKGCVGYVEPFKPHKGDFPTLGFELEVECVDGNGARNKTATRVRDLVKQLPNLSTEKKARRYLSFENDGSLGEGGFEMVSGWTDLQTHASAMRHVLEDESGRGRWVGVLRSHNASDGCCGLHVHISKPKSLVHASKIRYFMSAGMFKPLVKAVARRYDVSYARTAGKNDQNEPGSVHNRYFDKPEKSAGMYYKKYKANYNRRYLTPQAKVPYSAEDIRLNSDRYEHANFQNPNTVEFRVFRGTMVYRTFMACLELTQAVWFYCRDTATASMSQDSFLDFINSADMAPDTSNLRALLKDKGFSARVPKKAKPVVCTHEDTIEA